MGRLSYGCAGTKRNQPGDRGQRTEGTCWTHPVHLHDLEPLGDVGRVGGQPGASGHEAHEEDALLVGELVQRLPEPLDQRVLLVHLAVAHHLLQHVAADLRHPADHLLQLLGRQQGQQWDGDDPGHALPDRRHLHTDGGKPPISADGGGKRPERKTSESRNNMENFDFLKFPSKRRRHANE